MVQRVPQLINAIVVYVLTLNVHQHQQIVPLLVALKNIAKAQPVKTRRLLALPVLLELNVPVIYVIKEPVKLLAQMTRLAQLQNSVILLPAQKHVILKKVKLRPAQPPINAPAKPAQTVFVELNATPEHVLLHNFAMPLLPPMVVFLKKLTI